jgi:hypothetical protein
MQNNTRAILSRLILAEKTLENRVREFEAHPRLKRSIERVNGSIKKVRDLRLKLSCLLKKSSEPTINFAEKSLASIIGEKRARDFVSIWVYNSKTLSNVS